jgi:hypothetical protein
VKRGLIIAAAAALALVLAAAACATEYGEATPACTGSDCDGSAPEASSASDAGSDSDGDAPGIAVCDASAYDLAGCVCESSGARVPCYQGVPGPKSACTIAGVQTCESKMGRLLWSACVGGTKPAPEICHNDIDESCDGRIDDGCPCTDSVDLCRSDAGALFDPNAYTTLTVPAQPTAGQPFDLYILTRDKPLVGPDLARDPGGLCLGGSSKKACPSVGKGCAGWKVTYYRLTEPAGTYTYRFLDPPSNPPCNVGTQIANAKVIVQ